jgi:tetratricopeptide (TPR) repeat protein
LAGLYDSQERYKDAEPLYRRALQIAEKTFGPDHPHVASSLNNLGGTLVGLGNYKEAELVLVKAQAIIENTYGVAHPYVASGLENLAEFYEGTGRADEAGSLRARAQEIRKGLLKGRQERG